MWGCRRGPLSFPAPPLRNGKERRLPTSRLKKKSGKSARRCGRKKFFLGAAATDPEIDIHISTKAVWVKIEGGGGEWSVRWELPILFCFLPRSASGTCRKFSTSGKEGAPPPPHPSSHLLHPISSAHLPNSHYTVVEKEGKRPLHFFSLTLCSVIIVDGPRCAEGGKSLFLSSLSLFSFHTGIFRTPGRSPFSYSSSSSDRPRQSSLAHPSGNTLGFAEGLSPSFWETARVRLRCIPTLARSAGSSLDPFPRIPRGGDSREIESG